MRRFVNLFSAFFLFISVTVLSQVHHNLNVLLDPYKNYIQVSDSLLIQPSAATNEVHFMLHADLSVRLVSGAAEIIETDMPARAEYFGVSEKNWSVPEDIKLVHYIIKLSDVNYRKTPVVLRYEGTIYHEIKQLSEEYARGFSETPGIISPEGVYLGGSSYWVPWFDNQLFTYKLSVSLQQDWDAVSQGKQVVHEPGMVQWDCDTPAEEIYLIAGPFTIYKKQVDRVAVMAYLRSPDAALANKYLETTGQYLEMYRELVGPYPYSKFALVENFWETGYGMPSFTLLGSKVIRFPFILHSSYPHELLHNWWGNGVYVDYSGGNWCEGLTAYLADHLIKEQRGQGAEYRRTALQAYTDYVNESNEFSLSEFKSRTDAASSAIGYNKSLMIFHMLRQQAGDDLFTKVLQKFYQDNKFQRAGFQDIREALESVTNISWSDYFRQWIDRSGAPRLELNNASIKKVNGKFNLTFSLSQTQGADAFDLQVPVAVALEGEPESHVQRIELKQKEQEFSLLFEKQPQQLFIDPEFDVFRTLDRDEIPPSLSHIFGTGNLLIVIPAEDSNPLREEYLKLAQKWASDKSRVIKIARDDTLYDLAGGCSIWLFGQKNKFREVVIEKMSEYNAGFDGNAYRFGKTVFQLAGASVVTVVSNPEDPDETVVWMHTDNPDAIPGLGRKLPHYGKYSYLAFEGSEPTNTVKGQWSAINSPLFVSFAEPTAETEVTFAERNALADLAPLFSEDELIKHVGYLSDEKLEGRGFGSTGLWQAAEYIADRFKEIGLKPGGNDGSFFQQWQDTSSERNDQVVLRNIVGVMPGSNSEWQSQAVIICAHYDHLGNGWPDVRPGNEGKIHPGADDNASGVAVLLEIARIMAQKGPRRTIIFIAFTAEESGLRGSRYFVQHLQDLSTPNIMGVLNLDTVGRLFNNKLLIIGSSSAQEWKHIVMGVGFVTGIPYEIVTQDIDASDQVSFLESGIPGLQFFTGPHSDYHRPGDTVDKIDVAGMVKVANFVKESLSYLANEREEPLTVIRKEMGSLSKSSEKQAGKRAATGIMPDFTFSGPGVRVGEVSEGSAASKAGLQKGDVILAVGGNEVADLKSYADILRRYQPGDVVDLQFRRNEGTLDVRITLGSR